MSDAPSYEITEIADFAKVPPRRLRACLKEFAVCIEMARRTQKLLQTVQDELHPGTEPVAWPLHRFTWIDDKAKAVTVNLLVRETEARKPTTGATPSEND